MEQAGVLKAALVTITLMWPSCWAGNNESCEASSGLVLSGSYKMLSRCSSGHIGEALQIGESCEPRPTVVRLPWPQNSSQIDQMTPTHITLLQCDGSCHQFGHACSPTRITRRNIPVLLSRCGIASGVCAKECATLEVEEHAACSCSCQLTARDCPPGQLFRPELCACQCQDAPAKQACLDAGRTWHEETCSCACAGDVEEPPCDEGFVFDRQQRCACIPLAMETPRDNADEADLSQHDSHNSVPSLEIIVIVILLAIILVLLSLVFSLVMRIQRMNRRMKGQGNKSSSTKAEVIEEEVSCQQRQEEEEQLMIYTEVNCSTPSSGFYSEMGQGGCCGDQQQLQQPHHQPQHQLFQQQQRLNPPLQQIYQPLYRLQADFDALYQSAEAVRLNKKLFAGHLMASPGSVAPAVPSAAIYPSHHIGSQRPGVEGLVASSPSTGMYSPLATRKLGSPADSPGDGNGLSYDRSLPASYPIDEAVRRLQMEAQQ